MRHHNHNSVEEILKRGRSVRLSDFDRGEIRKSLLNVIEAGASRPRAPRRVRVFSWSYSYLRVGLVSFFVLMLGAGTSFAAEGTLPGDTLYAIKVGVNEKVETLLAGSAKALAEVTARHALTRLAEAETLAAQGKLDAERKTEVEKHFYESVADLRSNIKKLEGSGDYTAATNVSSSFEEGLGEHLGAFVNLSGNAATATPEVVAIAGSVSSELQSTQNERVAISDREVSEAATTTLAQVEAASQSAKAKIGNVERLIVAAASTTPTPVYAVLEDRLGAAKDLFEQASALQEAGDYGEAFALFREAQSQVQDAKLLAILGSKVRHGLTVRTERPNVSAALKASAPKSTLQKGSEDTIQIHATLAPEPKISTGDMEEHASSFKEEKNSFGENERRGIKIEINRDEGTSSDEDGGVHLNIDL